MRRRLSPPVERARSHLTGADESVLFDQRSEVGVRAGLARKELRTQAVPSASRRTLWLWKIEHYLRGQHW